jgi:plasmid stability protein
MKTKLTILMPKELHIAVKVKAAKEDTTVSEVVRELLRRWVEEKEKPPPD